MMKLTLKDKDFLERLKVLCESEDLRIEMKYDGLRYLVLRQNYGDKIESHFNLSRQGIRWRFQRIMNEIYASAYETIYVIESLFGPELRPMIMKIAKDRVALRKKVQQNGSFEPYRR